MKRTSRWIMLMTWLYFLFMCGIVLHAVTEKLPYQLGESGA
jgi:hypothetical protein